MTRPDRHAVGPFSYRFDELLAAPYIHIRDSTGELIVTGGHFPKQELISPLQGNGNNQFDVELALVTIELTQARLPKQGIKDAYSFQIYIRMLATIYYFLGGVRFSIALKTKLHSRFSEEEIENWIDTENAPRYAVRRQAIDSALELVNILIEGRKGGLTLGDIFWSQY